MSPVTIGFLEQNRNGGMWKWSDLSTSQSFVLEHRNLMSF